SVLVDAPYFEKYISIQAGGRPCHFTLTSHHSTRRLPGYEYRGTFDCTEPVNKIEDLEIHSALFADYFQNFEHFITVSIGSGQWELLFNQQNEDYPSAV